MRFFATVEEAAVAAEREEAHMLDQVAERPSRFFSLPLEWKENEAFVKNAVRASRGAVLRYVPHGMKRRPGWESLLLEMLEHSIDGVQHATIEQRSSKDFIMRAVSIRGRALRFASSALRLNADVAVAAIAKCASAMVFVHRTLREDNAFWRRAIEHSPRVLSYGRYMHELIDRDLVLAAVSKKGWLLRYAHPVLRADAGIVRAAVANDGHALKYSASPLRADERTVRLAVANEFNAIVHASNVLWQTIDRYGFVRRAALFHCWPQARLVILGYTKQDDNPRCPFSWLARDLMERILDEVADV
jgi:hypothetical protein